MKRKSGFTIIEVSLVLAIAGLIFLMAFIALPALQRSQRDARRREDMAELINAIKKYQSNNRGALPTSDGAMNWTKFYDDYLGSNFTDPDSSDRYALATNICDSVADSACGVSADYANATFPNGHKITVVIGAVCNGETAVRSNNPRRVAVLYKLEGGGIYCGNS